MGRKRRIGPLLPPIPAAGASAVDRLRRLGSRDPAGAAARAAGDAFLAPGLLAERAHDARVAGDLPGAMALAEEALALSGAHGGAVAAALHEGIAAALEGGDEERAEAWLHHLLDGPASPLAHRTLALVRLAMLYRRRNIPLGFRFYAGRALRFLDDDELPGRHGGFDLEVAHLATAVLDYLHHRDEPSRGLRAWHVLMRVREADPATTVQGLKFHGIAEGRLQHWDAARDAFLDAARVAEEHRLRGCDGVYVYAAAVRVQEKDFPGARRLLDRVHIRRLPADEKVLYRQFRSLVDAATVHRPLRGEKARRFLAEHGPPDPAEEPPPETPADPAEAAPDGALRRSASLAEQRSKSDSTGPAPGSPRWRIG